MKKLLFVIVSAVFATAGFAANAMESISNRSSDDDSVEARIEKQKNQPLILQKTIDNANSLAWHYSHYSHGSHWSHGSHYSHRSHYSGRW